MNTTIMFLGLVAGIAVCKARMFLVETVDKDSSDGECRNDSDCSGRKVCIINAFGGAGSRASCQHCQYDRDCPRGKICNRSKCDPDPWADYSDVDCNGAGSCHIDNVGNETGQDYFYKTGQDYFYKTGQDYVGISSGNQNQNHIDNVGNETGQDYQGRRTGISCNSLESKINQARTQGGLPALGCDQGMRNVANSHVKDNQQARQQGLKLDSKCNLHSWQVSNACCYTSNHKNPNCMWKKPEQLYGDKRPGYEISAAGSGIFTDDKIMDLWRKSPGHNGVIMGQGGWNKLKKVGCSHDSSNAHCWFANTF